MSRTSTYSFSDVSLVLSHPKVGQFTFTGEGVGSITIARSTDLTQHDIAADGSVMVTKVVVSAGTVALALQQTSAGHKFMRKWIDYLTVAPTEEWAQTTAILKNPSLGETITMNGVSPQKRADAAYQQAGQQVTWNLMAAEISG